MHHVGKQHFAHPNWTRTVISSTQIITVFMPPSTEGRRCDFFCSPTSSGVPTALQHHSNGPDAPVCNRVRFVDHRSCLYLHGEQKHGCEIAPFCFCSLHWFVHKHQCQCGEQKSRAFHVTMHSPHTRRCNHHSKILQHHRIIIRSHTHIRRMRSVCNHHSKILQTSSHHHRIARCAAHSGPGPLGFRFHLLFILPKKSLFGTQRTIDSYMVKRAFHPL